MSYLGQESLQKVTKQLNREGLPNVLKNEKQDKGNFQNTHALFVAYCSCIMSNQLDLFG